MVPFDNLKNMMNFLSKGENAYAHKILLSVEGNYRPLNPSMNHYCKEEWKYVWSYKGEMTVIGEKEISVLNM